MTRSLLIRHADTSASDGGKRLSGWHDAPLSPAGLEQLARARNGCFDLAAPSFLYSSTSSRARLTADASAAAWNMDLLLEQDLREIHCGYLEGAVIHDVESLYPDLWARNLAQKHDDFSWPGGESYVAFRRRVLYLLSSLARRHDMILSLW
jgi:broad specificity phosphatase PhoE